MSHPAPESTQPGIKPEHRIVLGLLMVSAFLVMLNETVVSVALPRMMEDLGITPALGQWLLTAFMLTMAVVIPMTGFIMRRLSTRTLFNTAMLVFSIGTIVAIASVAFGPATFTVLIVARVIQALATGVMMPLLMTTIMTLVPPHQRGRVMGYMSVVIAAAPVIGPLVGGFIVSVAHWSWIFVAVLPVAVAGLVVGLRRMVNVTETDRAKVDVLSVVLSAIAFSGLVFGLSEFGSEAQAQLDPAAVSAGVSPWIPLGVGLVTLVGFVLRQLQLQRVDDALIDLRVFAGVGFRNAVLMMLAINVILFGSLVLLPLYIQTGLGFEPYQAALIILPGALLMALAGPQIGKIYDRVGPRPLLVPGSMLTLVALGLMALIFDDATPWWGVAGLYCLLCVGLSMQFGPLFTSALGSLSPQLIRYGSATVGTLQQLAGAAGTSLFIVMFTLTAVSTLQGVTGPSTAELAHAYVAGTHTALVVAAVAMIVPVALAFTVRRPENETAAVAAH